jgi:hypothetical protein
VKADKSLDNEQQNTSLTITVDGDSVSLESFWEIQKHFSIIFDEVDKARFGEKKRSVKWRISSVSTGSYNLTITGVPIKGNDTLKVMSLCSVIQEGISIIAEEPSRPKFFSDRALKSLEALGNTIGNGISKLQLKGRHYRVDFTKRMAANVDELIGVRHESFGSIEGVLDAINLHNDKYFTIYSFLDDRGVKCLFPDELLEEAKKYLGRKVYVYGLVRSREDGQRLNIVVREMEPLLDPEEAPTIYNMIGILSQGD